MINAEPGKPETFSEIQPALDGFLPLLRSFAVGRYAIAISGSYGKGTHDVHSDIDLRLYADDFSATYAEMWAAFQKPKEEWTRKGVTIDDFWPRKIGEMDAAIAKWEAGDIQTDHPVWTVWGYQLLPDVYHQRAIDDPFAIVAGWKTRLRVYPPKLKQALLDKHLGSLRYWRQDYHYANKVSRQDVIFLAGLSARLVHDVIQALFALNETYYVGDGSNLDFVAHFRHQPAQLAQRVRAILYPAPSAGMFEEQRNTLLALIDDVECLAKSLTT